MELFYSLLQVVFFFGLWYIEILDTSRPEFFPDDVEDSPPHLTFYELFKYVFRIMFGGGHLGNFINICNNIFNY